jgi:hypothetical protein
MRAKYQMEEKIRKEVLKKVGQHVQDDFFRKKESYFIKEYASAHSAQKQTFE